MSSLTIECREALVTNVRVTGAALVVDLDDGRTIIAPVSWYPRLAEGTAKERRDWRLIGGGRGIHWPSLEEDISVANLLAGQRSSESKTSLKRWLTRRSGASKQASRAPKLSARTSDRRNNS